MSTIIARAKVPTGSDLAVIQTIPLPKVRQEPPTQCPPWCVKHTIGTPGFPADRTTSHEATRTTVATTFTSGPQERTVDRHEVEVWAERFDGDAEVDGHPVVGYPAVHLAVDGYDSTGMTAGQAEQIGRALLTAAANVRRAETRPETGTSPVWPPAVCPAWCSDADDPAGGHERHNMHPSDRIHWHGYPSEEAESVYLSLHSQDMAHPPGFMQLIPQRLTLAMKQHYRQAEPTIHLDHTDRGWKRTGVRPDFAPKKTRRVKLTLDEAMALADKLAYLARIGGWGR